MSFHPYALRREVPMHVLEAFTAATPEPTIPTGFVIVERADGTRFARPSFLSLATLNGPAWDGSRMRVIELGAGR